MKQCEDENLRKICQPPILCTRLSILFSPQAVNDITLKNRRPALTVPDTHNLQNNIRSTASLLFFYCSRKDELLTVQSCLVTRYHSPYAQYYNMDEEENLVWIACISFNFIGSPGWFRTASLDGLPCGAKPNFVLPNSRVRRPYPWIFNVCREAWKALFQSVRLACLYPASNAQPSSRMHLSTDSNQPRSSTPFP
jgi:hypothetical protein